MSGRRRDDVQRIARGGGFGDRFENVQLKFLAYLARRLGVRVKNAGEFHDARRVQFGINPRVMLTERTGAENGDFDFIRDA